MTDRVLPQSTSRGRFDSTRLVAAAVYLLAASIAAVARPVVSRAYLTLRRRSNSVQRYTILCDASGRRRHTSPSFAPDVHHHLRTDDGHDCEREAGCNRMYTRLIKILSQK